MATQQQRQATERRPKEERRKNQRQLPLLDIAGLAIQLGVTERFVRRLVEDNRVPYHKIGKFVRFHPDDITAWVASKRVTQVHTD